MAKTIRSAKLALNKFEDRDYNKNVPVLRGTLSIPTPGTGEKMTFETSDRSDYIVVGKRCHANFCDGGRSRSMGVTVEEINGNTYTLKQI